MTGDDAFTDFVRTNTPSLYGTAFMLTGNRHQAEELLQDTLARLYPKWAAVTAADAPIAYVRRAVANRFVSSRRPASARDLAVWELPDRWDGLDLGETVAVSRTIWQLLGTLPERQRAAVVLRYFHDLPDDDIAASLGCRAVTVRSLVSRGIAAMRSAYTSDDDASADGGVR